MAGHRNVMRLRRAAGIVPLMGSFVLSMGPATGLNAEGRPTSLVPWTAAERIGTGFQFTEGPVWTPEGFLLFSDVQANRIVKWTAPDATESFRQPSGNSNGLAFDQQGRLIACEHSNRRISRTELTGKVVTVAGRYEDKRLNSPNDLVIKSDGSIYFTDPPYGIDPGQQELTFNGVFRISPVGDLTVLATDFDRPNGLAFSPDEKKLYIADTTQGHLRVFDVQADGTLGGGEVFVQVSSPDGMTADGKGNLYVASQTGVVVFTPRGDTIGTIEVPEQPTNCCFGRADRRALFITARTSLYRVEVCESDLAKDAKRNITLTWTSIPGKTYSIYQSSDSVTWELAAADVASSDGAATKWVDPTGPLLSIEVRRRYYRVKENE